MQHAFRRLKILFLLLNIVLCLRSAEARRLETDAPRLCPATSKPEFADGTPVMPAEAWKRDKAMGELVRKGGVKQ